MRLTGRLQEGLWQFTDESGSVVFSSMDMDEETAVRIVSAVNAHDDLIEASKMLLKARDGYQMYDGHLSPQNIKQICIFVQAAVDMAVPSVDREVTITTAPKRTLR